MRFEWNGKNTELLILKYKEGYSIKEISKFVGCKSLKTPINKLEELGLWNRIRITEKEEEYIVENFGKKNSSEIGKIIGKTSSAVTHIWRKNGLRTEKFIWNEDKLKILSELYPYEEEEIILERLGATDFNNVRNKAIKLGIKRNRIYTKNDLIFILTDLYKKLGRTPSILDLEDISVNPFVSNFGSYSNACEAAGLIPNMSGRDGKACEILYSKNKDKCFSVSEVIITNFLIDNNIKYRKEVKYKEISADPDFGEMKMDWLINDTIAIEFFGLKDKDYLVKSKMKINLCIKNNIKMISLYRKDLNKLKDILPNIPNDCGE